MKSTNIPVGTDDSAHTDLNPVALLVIPHMMSVHSKSVLYNDGVKVACVAYLLTARADFKQLQVFLRLALPIQHLFLYVSAPLQDTVAPISTTLVFPRVVHHAFASWLGLQSLIRTRTECRLPPLEPLQASEYHVPALGGRVLSFILSVLGTVVQVFSSDSLRSRSRAAG